MFWELLWCSIPLWSTHKEYNFVIFYILKMENIIEVTREEMDYYRSKHASARRKTDEELEEFIRFAKFIGHIIFESEAEKLRERRKKK